MSIVKQYYVNLQIHHSGDRWSSPPTPSTSPPTWKHLTGQCHWPLADTGCAIPRSVASHIVVSWWVLMRTLLIWSLMTCDHDLYILLVEPVETWTEYITPPTHKNDVIGNVDRIIFLVIKIHTYRRTDWLADWLIDSQTDTNTDSKSDSKTDRFH